jgi:integrase
MKGVIIMPQSKRATSGMGSIRKVTKAVKGKEYTYFEARYTEGFDPGTGKQIQRSITDKSKKIVAQKLREVLNSLDKGDYITPSKITVGEWLDKWAEDYLGAVKPATVCAYKATIATHLKPGLGAVKLNALDPQIIQKFYNNLTSPKKDKKPTSPKTVKNIHGVLHKALQQAVANGYLRINPTDACVLPRVEKKEIKPLDEDQITTFLKAIRGHQFEYLFVVTLFTGMREAEALGLTWDCVNFENSTITINKQLQMVRGGNGEYRLVSTKNGKSRTVSVAPFVADTLRKVQYEQRANKVRCGAMWNDSGFVFTNPMGEHLKTHTVYKNFKTVVKKLGYDSARFHDLRHAYAVASIKSGDDIKTVQENLGHATASFTLDVYGHVTSQMKRESAARMEKFIRSVNQ